MADTEPRPETVHVTIDGKEIEAHAGEMVIAAAERNGVYIPRFCYHPRMKPVGMCRMCLVDIKGPRGFMLQPACFVPVADGQEVVTKSPAVKKAQDGVLEFLLVNHPLDCPVCDRGGECPLQDQTFAFGPGESRFVEEKRHWEKPIPLSDLVLLDRERCIQCARCTRFADEIAGDPLIEFVGRADHTEVNTFPGEPFASYFSGNTVQICPVGALLAQPYRFKARPWDLEQVESTCTSCAVGCRVTIQSSANRVTRYLGVDSDPVNHGWLCDKGRFDYQHLEQEDRLAAPLVRKGDELVEASWGEAMAAASQALRDVRELHGPGSIAFLGGARLTNEDAYAWAKLAKGIVGTDHVDCQLGDGLPAELVLGLPRATIDEACRAKVVLLLAPDLKEELPVLYLRLRQAAVEGGSALVELVPQATGLSRYARHTLTYRPGEAAAVARALVGEGEPRGEVGGVAAGALAAARELVRGGDVVVVVGRPSLAEADGLVADAVAVLADALPEARFLPALRRGNVHGALDMGLAPGVLPGRVSLDEGRAWFSQRWGVIPEERGMDAAGILQAASEGRVQALVLLGADPISDFPDRDLARRALAGAGSVIAVDIFLNESSKQADVVLAASGYAERGGTTTNLEGRITRLSQKVTAPGTARADWIIAAELAFGVGGDLGFDSTAALWAEVEHLAPAYEGVTAARLGRVGRRDGIVVPMGEVEDAEAVPPGAPSLGSDIERQAVAAQGETVQPRSESAPDAETSEAAGGERPPLLRFSRSPSSPPPPTVDAYSLRLVASRRLYDAGVLNQHSPALAPLAPGPQLRANPSDLDRLGVATGGRVKVTSARTTLTLPVAPDAGVPRGSLSIAFNQPGDGGAADLIDVSQPVTDVRLESA